MSVLKPRGADDFVQFDRDEYVAIGESLNAQYQSAEPFPHTVLDDFLPFERLSRVVAEFPARRPG